MHLKKSIFDKSIVSCLRPSILHSSNILNQCLQFLQILSQRCELFSVGRLNSPSCCFKFIFGILRTHNSWQLFNLKCYRSRKFELYHLYMDNEKFYGDSNLQLNTSHFSNFEIWPDTHGSYLEPSCNRNFSTSWVSSIRCRLGRGLSGWAGIKIKKT